MHNNNNANNNGNNSQSANALATTYTTNITKDANTQDITNNINANNNQSNSESNLNQTTNSATSQATSQSASQTPSHASQNAIVEAETEAGIDYSVSQLCVAINNAIKYKFSNIYVRGEVSGFKISNSGHMFFSLKDADNIVHAVCFSRFAKNIDIEIIDGIELIVYGEVTMHESVCRIKVYNMRYTGVGSVMAIIEERKQRLLDAGLFDVSIKKPIPKSSHIQKIGLITSATGAVLHDIQNRISARFPKEIVLFPCSVQGAHAAEEITQAIEYFTNLHNTSNTGNASNTGNTSNANDTNNTNTNYTCDTDDVCNTCDIIDANSTNNTNDANNAIPSPILNNLNGSNITSGKSSGASNVQCASGVSSSASGSSLYSFLHCDVDVLIIARGGGSFEDMLCFNDESLAIAAYNCPIPIISAVGHETDFCILDFVADLRASTPTAAAEIVTTPTKKEIEAELSAFAAMSYESVSNYIEDDLSALSFCANIIAQGDAMIARKEISLSDASTAVKDAFANFIKNTSDTVADFYNTIRDEKAEIIEFINNRNLKLIGNSNKVESTLFVQILKMQNKIESAELLHNSTTNRFLSAINNDIEKCDRYLASTKYYLDRFLDQAKTQLKDYERFINSNNPQAILRRGFAIVKDSNGNVVRDAKNVSSGGKYTATLNNGTATLIGQ